MLRVFNPDITGFNATTIQEARERQVLANRVFLILGSGPLSMGGAAAREIILQGGTAVLSSRENENGDPRNPKMLEFVKQLGGKAEWRGCDVARLITVADDKGREAEMFDSRRVIMQVAAAHNRLDGLIVASGSMENTASFRRIKRERAQEIYTDGAEGPMFAVLAAADQMIRQNPQSGRIAVVGSISGRGNAFQIEYSMAKAALHAGVTALADELDILKQAAIAKGREPHDIQVNAIAPGLVDTPLVTPLSAEIRQGIVTKSGAERELHPGEPGSMLAFLMGPYADGINGQVIPMLGRGEIPSWLAA